MEFSDILIYFEFVTFFVALILFKKIKTPFYKYFLMYVSAIFIVELLASHFIEKNNFYLYNIYTFFEFNLIVLMYYSLTKEKISHTIFKYFLVIFNLIYFLSFILKSIEKYNVILLAIFISICSIVYLRELLNSNKIINYNSNLFFWITVGILLYYLPTIPLFYLIYVKSFDTSLFYILHIFTVITHLCFIFGLLWSRKMES